MTRCKQRAHLLPTRVFDIFATINAKFFALLHFFHSCWILPHSSATTSDHRDRQDVINVLWQKKLRKSPKKREKEVEKFLKNCFWASLTRKRCLAFGCQMGLRQPVLPQMPMTKFLPLICIFAFQPTIRRIKIARCFKWRFFLYSWLIHYWLTKIQRKLMEWMTDKIGFLSICILMLLNHHLRKTGGPLRLSEYVFTSLKHQYEQ